MRNYGARSDLQINESENMNRRNAAMLLVAVVLGGVPLTLWGNGMRLVSQDGFASARGEAFVATADNPSAIYYNPAGITQLESHNLRGGIYGIYLDQTFTATNGNTFQAKDKFAAAPNLFYTFTLREPSLSFGLGLYAPYGGRVTWPEDTGFREAGIESELTHVRFNPVAAVKLTPGLSFGCGLAVDYSRISLKQGISPFYQPPNVHFGRFEGDGWGVGYNVGLIWQPYKKVSVGGTFRSATTITMSGHSELEKTPGPVTRTNVPAEMTLPFPWNFAIGISYRPTPKWNLEFDADYTDWGRFGTVILHQQGPLPFGVPQGDRPLVFKWQSSWMYSLGVTRYFDGGWHASAGYVFNEQSVPDATYTPLVPDMDRHFFSIGAGYKGKRYDFDITYQFGYGPAHKVTGSVPPSVLGEEERTQTADGTYDFISHAVLVSAGVRF
jgi:long-chain fatty acid transport protein